jgi:hypothetical protein
MGHTEIRVTMNVYGHLFEGAQGQLIRDLDDLLDNGRSEAPGEGGKRADGAEKGREAQVNNGHLRSTTVTRKPLLSWANIAEQALPQRTIGGSIPPSSTPSSTMPKNCL